MATTQKKSGGTRSASTSKSKSRASSGRSGSRARAQAKPFRRELGAAVCLVLALLSAFGYFNVKALFIDLFSGLLKGLVGYGYWIIPPVLLMAFYILTFHRGRPVRLRLSCTLLLPLVLGIMLHMFLSPGYEWSRELFGQLWESGTALKSGGVLGGVLAMAATQALSRPGTAILLAVAAFFMGLTACNRSILDIVDYLRSRPRLEYEPEESSRPARRARGSVPASAPRRAIDIPVDDGPLAGREEPEPQPEKKGFFNRQPSVKTPDQVLISAHAAPTQPEPEPEPVPPAAEPELEPEPEPAPDPEPVPAHAAAPVPEIVREPAVVKDSRSEAAQAAEELERSIRQSMELGQDAPPYQHPPLSLLRESRGEIGGEALGELSANRRRLEDTLHSFGVEASIQDVIRGPSVTRYELELKQGMRLSKLTNLSGEIALSLGVDGVRIAPIPDKISMVGIEVPNRVVSPVSIREVIGSAAFSGSRSKTSFAVGKDISGQAIVGDIGRLPHLLIAGTTGSGKSVCTNTIITSLLYKASPEEVRLIMVDPKMVELGIYNGIPHLLIPVVTDPKKAAGALQWAVTEMMKRYRTFSEVGVRKLEEYNAYAQRTEGVDKLPSVVVLIDELADLMLVAAKEVEESIVRVAQMGRAAGMHLVIATQRPSADVITGVMKANIPSRIAFAVASAMESRIILDNSGAEKLVGRGDMLYAPLGSGKPQRVQGCFISDEEVAAVVDFVKRGGAAQYDDAVMHEIERNAADKEKGSKNSTGPANEEENGSWDELLPSAIEVVVETGQASVSMLQRRLKLGYARAARLVDQMEEKGIIGPFGGAKPRQVLISREQWQEMQFKQGIVLPGRQESPAPEDPSFGAGLPDPPEDEP